MFGRNMVLLKKKTKQNKQTKRTKQNKKQNKKTTIYVRRNCLFV